MRELVEFIPIALALAFAFAAAWYMLHDERARRAKPVVRVAMLVLVVVALILGLVRH